MDKSTRPLVSVCIANFNGEHLLHDCINSVLLQQGDFNLEIIVHDDASTDDSLATLACFPQARVIKSSSNVGFCISNNRMVDVANGQYVLLLNNDAALLTDAIVTLLQTASQSSSRSILTLPQYDWESKALVDRGCLLDPFHVPVPNLDSSRKHVAYVIGACLWVAREDWIELGGFPEWMSSIGEDIFICAHARLLGMQIKVTADSGYRHRQGASFGGNRTEKTGLSTNYHRRYLSERNRAALLITCTPSMIWLPWLFAHVAILVAEGLVLSILKLDKKIWSKVYGASIRWLWRERLLLWNVRKKTQRNCSIGFLKYLQKAYTWKVRKLIMLINYGLPNLK